MADFSINNINAAMPGQPGMQNAAKSQQIPININDSFKPSLKSATSPIDLKAAAKLFNKKVEELPNVNWEFNTGTRSQFYSTPLVTDDGKILVKSFDMKLYAIDSQTGQKLWDYNTGAYSQNQPTVGPDGIVFFDTNGSESICAVDGKTGDKLWEKKLGGRLYSHSPMMGKDGNVYVSNGYYGSLYGFDPKTGEEKVNLKTGHHSTLLRGITDDGRAIMLKDNSFAIGVDIKSGEKLWECSVGPEFQEVRSIYTPDGHLFATSTHAELTGVDTNTGKVKWRFNAGKYPKQTVKTFQIGIAAGSVGFPSGAMTTGTNRELLDKESWVQMDPVVGKDGKFYVTDNRGMMFAMDPDTGKPAWIYDSPSEILTAPMVTDNGEIYLGNSDKEVIKLDAKTGTEIWKKKMIYEPKGKPVVNDANILFMSTNNGTTVRFDTETGKQLKSYETPGRDNKMAVIPGDPEAALVGDDNGKLICIGRTKFVEDPEETKAADGSEASEEKNLKIEKGKEFIDIGGVRLNIKKKE